MTPLELSTTVLLVLDTVGLITLGIHYAFSLRSQNHPERLSAQLHSLQLEHADLVDKVTYYMKRERVRKLRESNNGQQEIQLPENPRERKKALRSRLFGQQLGLKQ